MNEHVLVERGISYRTNAWVPGRKTLVFMHGLVGSSSAWIPFEQHFTESYNILTFDLRGHGLSLKPQDSESYAIKNFVDDLHALVSQLGATKFTLISHSFGTLIALEFLAIHAEMVESLVFLSPAFSLNKIGKTRVMKLVYNVLGGLTRILPFWSNVHGRTDYTKYIKTGDWNIGRTIADLWNTSLHVYFYCMKHVYAVEQEALLEQITTPTLLIHGRKDGMFPVENSLIMAKRIKNSKLLILEEADHIIVLNNEKEITEAMDTFLK